MKILHSPFSISHARGGFTLVELIVAVGLFLSITAIASGSFIQTLRTQRQVADMIASESTASLILEQMAREIRTGFNFCQGSSPCASSSELNFTSAAGETISYRLSGDYIERGVGGSFQKLTGGNVSVRYFKFILSGTQNNDGWPPRVTILLGVSTKNISASGAVARMQTTVSARTPDG